MAKFMLILHDNMPALGTLSPADMQRIIAEYGAWSDRMAQAGRLVGGDKLKDEGGKHLSLVKGKYTVRDGPYAEAKEVVGGYFVIEAADYAEITTLAADCPHLALGGRIEVREIDPI
ncbi:MAG: YciI family protein [Gemmatimonadaceae bacterium]